VKRIDAMTLKFKLEKEKVYGYKDEDDEDENENGDGYKWYKKGNDLKLNSNMPPDGAKVLAKVIKSMKKVRRVHIYCDEFT